MSDERQNIYDLIERKKELNCLYRIMQILKDEEYETADVLKKVVQEIPYGWRYSGICMAKLIYQDMQFTTPYFFETKWYQSAEIIVDDNVMGEIWVYYAENITGDPETLFLPEEQHLLNNIAEQVSLFIFNRRLKETIGYFQEGIHNGAKSELLPMDSDHHWKWREKMAYIIADRADFEWLDIKAIYIIGSTKEGTAGPASDLDLLVHTDAEESQKELLKTWIDGWSQCLAEINYERTGYRLNKLIDLHLVTTREMKDKKSSFATMIGSLDNSATLIRKGE